MKQKKKISGSYYSNKNGRILRGSSSGVVPIYNVDGDFPIHCVGYSSYTNISGGSGDEESCGYGGITLIEEHEYTQQENVEYERFGKTESFNHVKEVEAQIAFSGGASALAAKGDHTDIFVSCKKGTKIYKALTTLFGEGWKKGVYSMRVQAFWACSCAYRTSGNSDGTDRRHTHDVDYDLLAGLEFFYPPDPEGDPLKPRKSFFDCSVEEQLSVIISAYEAGVTKQSLQYVYKAYWEDEFTFWDGSRGKSYPKVVVSDLKKFYTLNKSEGLENTIKALTKGITDLVLKVGYQEAMRLLRRKRTLSYAMRVANGKHLVAVTGYQKRKSYAPQFLRIAA